MILAIMKNDFNEARIIVPDDSLLKNSTFGLDSGLASSNEATHDMSRSSGENDSRHLSALSSIRGLPPPIG